MAFSLSLGNKRPINLIFNDHSIRYLELKSANPPTALRWGERNIPPGIIEEGKITDFQTLSVILEECINEWKIARRPIHFIVPDPLVIIRKIAIPADVEDDEIDSHLYMELGASIHLPFEDPVFDVYPLGEKDGKKELLLFASPEKFVQEYSELISGAKLVPVAADISPLALYRLYYSLEAPQPDESLFTVQVNLTSVNMTIFEEQVPYFMRQFPLDFEVNDWEIRRDRSGTCEYQYKGDSYKLDGQFSMIYSEMNKLMDFYRYSANVETTGVNKILLVGDHPLLDRIHDEMKEQFDLPIFTFPTESIHNSRNKSLPQTHALALGLSLKEVR
ncbi:pilus assembly protein PilM [Bacillus sp. FJAT-27225]|uniref:type IV pilus biogenesis protein PilM n=1 Tax=Bacillus sp. FJAT-27225 TaxID=1743144 RepID=UPI00080C21A6|nr:pilus assembly protein PilM [Bacillus sp. FJAT-27225]OCA91259.1 pilus assembly protein PilM [Bacillus sp. FJAT-27225]